MAIEKEARLGLKLQEAERDLKEERSDLRTRVKAAEQRTGELVGAVALGAFDGALGTFKAGSAELAPSDFVAASGLVFEPKSKYLLGMQRSAQVISLHKLGTKGGQLIGERTNLRGRLDEKLKGTGT